MADIQNIFHFEPRRAAKAIGALLKNPDDLPQVFTILESFSGTAHWRLHRKFERSADGARLLRDKPDIVKMLANREWLSTLPEGSLGRAYLAFVESEGISADGIRDASAQGMTERVGADDFGYVHQRMRDTHDLWHAAVGYRGDVLGESALLAFSLAQNWNSGIALIVVAAILKGFSMGSTAVIAEGFRRGREAEFLPTLDWESLLALPVSEVRKRLRLGSPPVYEPVRTAQLREAGMI
jgi:ubiquinone biosynthesis protein COQ4